MVWMAGLTAAVQAQPTLPDPKPVPRMQAVPQPYDQVSFQRDGVEIARYHFGPTLNRPFVFPVIGPSGRSLTRMGHPHDPITHSHHNSIWISHHDVNGVSFWGDQGKGRIVHQKVELLDDGPNEAAVVALNHWVNITNKEVFMTEWRRTALQPLANGEWMMVIDLQFEAKAKEVTFGKTPFGLVGVRMAKTIGVNDGGGMIRNSEGNVNEQGDNGCFWKPAKWCDYSGPIVGATQEGITLMDHPSNPNHPTVFHVRVDGWMGTALTFDGPRTLEPGKPLQLRYGFYVHAGKPPVVALQKQWEEFARTKPYEFKVKK